MLSWPTAATWADASAARGLDERVSTRLFGTCMSCTHPRHLTSGCRCADRCAKLRPPVSSVRWRGCVHDMHVPNSLDDTSSSSSRAPALAAAVDHESIFREASSASSLSDERRKNISNMPEIGETRKGWQGLIRGPSQWKIHSMKVLDSNVLISQDVLDSNVQVSRYPGLNFLYFWFEEVQVCLMENVRYNFFEF